MTEAQALKAAETRLATTRGELAAAIEAEREATSQLGAAIARGDAPTTARAALAKARERADDLQATVPHLEQAIVAAQTAVAAAARRTRVAKLTELKRERAAAAEALEETTALLLAQIERLQQLAAATRPLAKAHGAADDRAGQVDHLAGWLGYRLSRFWPGRFRIELRAPELPLAQIEREIMGGLV